MTTDLNEWRTIGHIGAPDVLAIWAEARRPDGEYIMGNRGTNGLPWPTDVTDLKHFREATRDRVLIMGRKTYESLPPILKSYESTKERPFIVLTSNRQTAYGIIESTVGLRNIQPLTLDKNIYSRDAQVTQALDVAGTLWRGKDIAVIGGAAVLEMFEPVCTRLLVSELHPDNLLGDRGADILAPSDSFFDGWFRADQRTLAHSTRIHYYTRRTAV